MAIQYLLPFIGEQQLKFIPDDPVSEPTTVAPMRTRRIPGQYSLAPLWMDKDDSDGFGVIAWTLGSAVVALIVLIFVFA